MTRLHEAIKNDETDAAIALINEGADLNAPSDDWTPLNLAIFLSRTTIALKLIEEGADLEAPSGGYTPLHWTIIYGATIHGATEIALKLIKEGADLEAPSKGKTLLHWALFFMETTIARELILKGPNINSQISDTKETPLHLAARTAPVSKELIKLLLNASPDMTLQDSDGVSVREAIQKSPKAEEAYDEYCAELSKIAIFSGEILESKGIPLEVLNNIVKFAFSQHGLYFSTKAQSDAKANMVTGVAGRILARRKNERTNNAAQSGPQDASQTALSEGISQLRLK